MTGFLVESRLILLRGMSGEGNPGKEGWREGDMYGWVQRLYFWMNLPRTSGV